MVISRERVDFSVTGWKLSQGIDPYKNQKRQTCELSAHLIYQGLDFVQYNRGNKSSVKILGPLQEVGREVI